MPPLAAWRHHLALSRATWRSGSWSSMTTTTHRHPSVSYCRHLAAKRPWPTTAPSTCAPAGLCTPALIHRPGNAGDDGDGGGRRTCQRCDPPRRQPRGPDGPSRPWRRTPLFGHRIRGRGLQKLTLASSFGTLNVRRNHGSGAEAVDRIDASVQLTLIRTRQVGGRPGNRHQGATTPKLKGLAPAEYGLPGTSVSAPVVGSTRTTENWTYHAFAMYARVPVELNVM
jgi:hypothetical protein